MVAIKNVLLFVAAATAAVLPRDAAQTLKDLQQIDTDTNKLTTTVNGWSGSVFAAIPITQAESAIENDIKTATTNSNGITASSAESQQIISYITSTLEPDIAKSLAALNNKKAQFKSAGLSSTVESDLKNLKSLTDSLSSNLQAAASSDQKTAAKSISDKIDSDFSAAIANFA